jgi:hypothetical protein
VRPLPSAAATAQRKSLSCCLLPHVLFTLSRQDSPPSAERARDLRSVPGRCRAGEMVDAVDFKEDGVCDVVLDHAQVEVAQPALEVGARAAEHVVDDDHLVAKGEEAVDKVRSDEAGTPRDGDAVAAQRREICCGQQRREMGSDYFHGSHIFNHNRRNVCTDRSDVFVAISQVSISEHSDNLNREKSANPKTCQRKKE